MHGLRSLTGAPLAALALLGAGPAANAAVPETTSAAGWAAEAQVRVERDAVLRSGAGIAPRLPAGRWALSLTLRAGPGAGLRITGPRDELVADLRALPSGRLGVRTRAGRVVPRRLTGDAGLHRIELVRDRVVVDGRRVGPGTAGAVRLTATSSVPVTIGALTVTPAARRDALLLHRVADLQARTPLGRFPLGEGRDGRLRFSGGWTSGFWPGALWGAARLVPGGVYDRWALDASLARRGAEDTLIHDVGFMFGRSVVTAHERRCRTGRPAATLRCGDLRASGLAAADTLVRLAGAARTGMIPTDATGPEAETIVDGLMNLGLLTWATRVSGEPRYADLARRHATRVLPLLLRPDGSTIQVATHDRATGRLLRLGTRQGISDSSTWARGQAWAIYGLAQVGTVLGDRGLIAASERAAAFWVRTAPTGTPPPYDLDAGPAAPRDSSAAAIAAAGMYRLARACAAVPGACAAPAPWTGAAGAALDAALTAVSATPPLGRLGDQAYAVGPRQGAWDDRAELIWGLDFALEAVAERALASARARP